MDPLQRLHTLDNLAELLRQPPAGVPRTLRDDSLQARTTQADVHTLYAKQTQLAMFGKPQGSSDCRRHTKH